ncbi:MAG: 4-diphosphocytidyl-2C-methyl-D-erythritol synthase [Solirubrobacterales bacterium]|nr:4-diphosphocytidyl-2C-methyl-D-erythritol synthase [Solirubrobacterales bacterium]
MAEPSPIVAVLAGGRGERLGGAKAMTRLGGRPLICHPLAAARGAGLETVVVAKRSTRLPSLREQVAHEPESPHHPLCGVLAALELAATRSPAPAVLLLACDMPFLTSPLLGWLASLEGTAMAEIDGRPQPLLARCTPGHLPALREALDERRSLTAAIEALSPRLVRERELARFGSPARLCFNVNDAADLRRAEGWL